MKAGVLLIITLILTACSDSDEGLTNGQVKEVVNICGEFNDKALKKQCLIDAFGCAAVTGVSGDSC